MYPLPMQMDTDFKPSTSIEDGVGKFVDWYSNHHDS